MNQASGIIPWRLSKWRELETYCYPEFPTENIQLMPLHFLIKLQIFKWFMVVVVRNNLTWQLSCHFGNIWNPGITFKSGRRLNFFYYFEHARSWIWNCNSLEIKTSFPGSNKLLCSMGLFFRNCYAWNVFSVHAVNPKF